MGLINFEEIACRCLFLTTPTNGSEFNERGGRGRWEKRGHLLWTWSLAWASMEDLVVPGTRLNAQGKADEGVYELDGKLYASVVGKITKDEVSGKVSVTPYPENACRSVVPSIDNVIIGVVH